MKIIISMHKNYRRENFEQENISDSRSDVFDNRH